MLLIGNNNQAPLTATKPREVLKQVVGLQEAYRTPLAPDIGALIVFQPQYVWSLRNGAQIAKVFFTAQPEALWPLFVPTPIGVPGFNAMVYARGALNVGDVTRPTTDPTLALTNKFTQAGAQGGIAITDTDPNSFFNGVSIPIDYTNLYGFTGQYKSVSQFSAAINYTFPKTKYTTIGVSYVDGRDLNTFEMLQSHTWCEILTPTCGVSHDFATSDEIKCSVDRFRGAALQSNAAER